MDLTKEEIIERKTKFFNKSKGYVYFLINNNEIIYIGNTINIEQRIKTHYENDIIEFDSYYFFQSDNYQGEEIKYIIKFNPKYNINTALKHLPKIGLISRTAFNKLSFSLNDSRSEHIYLNNKINFEGQANRIKSFSFNGHTIYDIDDLLKIIKEFYSTELSKYKCFEDKIKELTIN